MKRKSIAALALTCAFLFGTFAGCAKTPEPEETDASAIAAETQTLPAGETAPQPPESQLPEGQLPEGQPPEGQFPGGPGEGQLPGDPMENQELAKVTAVEGTQVTLALGSLDRTGFGRDRMGEGQNGQMPQPPDGQGQNGQMPQPPDGQGQNGQMPQQPDGQGQMGNPPDGQGFGPGAMGGRGGKDFSNAFTENGETLTLTVDEATAASLAVGDLVVLERDESGQATGLSRLENRFGQMGGPGGFDREDQGFGPGGMGGFPGGQGGASLGSAANTLTGDAAGETYASSAADENALRADGVTAVLTNPTLTKTGDSSDTETSDFYGMNAGLLALNGANLTLAGGSVTTDGAGANALFSYGAGTVLTVKDTVIRTAGRNSGGLQTAGGGTTQAENLDVETQGASAAAIRSDRGGGTVTVTGGSFVTRGTGSPAVYSTADITVRDAALTAAASEAIVVEGKNSVTLENCQTSGAMTGTYRDGSENLQGVMIYQSMSGDADVGKGSFTAVGGSLSTASGDLIYVTNTTAEIALEGVALTTANGVLLRVAGNDGSRGWGSQGSNGGNVTMTTADQVLTGDILVDEISTLQLTLGAGTAFTGSVNPQGSAGRVRLTLAEGATWSLTGDAWLTTFTGDAAAIETNGFHVYVGNTVLK